VLIGLLEDDLAIQEMLRLLLQSEGYEVTAYASAEECLTHLRIDDAQSEVACPNLLMVDLHLAKGISGLVVIEQIRSNPRLTSLPIVLMTASAFIDKQDLQRLHVSLLLKPFDIDEIIRIAAELKQAPTKE
jgi:CheY-like chemotaxis protein